METQQALASGEAPLCPPHPKSAESANVAELVDGMNQGRYAAFEITEGAIPRAAATNGASVGRSTVMR